jgi:hypothetical protein
LKEEIPLANYEKLQTEKNGSPLRVKTWASVHNQREPTIGMQGQDQSEPTENEEWSQACQAQEEDPSDQLAENSESKSIQSKPGSLSQRVPPPRGKLIPAQNKPKPTGSKHLAIPFSYNGPLKETAEQRSPQPEELHLDKKTKSVSLPVQELELKKVQSTVSTSQSSLSQPPTPPGVSQLLHSFEGILPAAFSSKSTASQKEMLRLLSLAVEGLEQSDLIKYIADCTFGQTENSFLETDIDWIVSHFEPQDEWFLYYLKQYVLYTAGV